MAELRVELTVVELEQLVVPWLVDLWQLVQSLGLLAHPNLLPG